MGTAMGAEFVTSIHDFLGKIGVLFHPKLYGEKGAFYTASRHRFKKLVGVFRAPRAVKGNGKLFFRRLYAVDRQFSIRRSLTCFGKDKLTEEQKARRPKEKGRKRNRERFSRGFSLRLKEKKYFHKTP
jgi:hypothetical protein